MKKMRLVLGLVTATMIAPGVRAQNEATIAHPALDLTTTNRPLNRISLSYRMQLNVKANFKYLGGFAPQTDPGPATGGAYDRSYDNGFSYVDSYGNDHGPGLENTTWNWGYDSAGQAPGNNTLSMQSSSAPATGRINDLGGGLDNGVEITYSREMGKLGEKMLWGLEGGFCYNGLGFHTSRTLTGPVTLLSDSFDLGGTVPPLTPYAGTFDGPGPLIGDLPGRTIQTVVGQATTQGTYDVDGGLYTFKVGPYLQIPIEEKFAAYFGLGLALGLANTEFDFRESTTIPGVGTQNTSANRSNTDLLAGFYVSGQLAYTVAENTTVFFGAQYQYLANYTQKVSGKAATLDFGAAVFVNIGVGYSF